jgi:hypothetical protein
VRKIIYFFSIIFFSLILGGCRLPFGANKKAALQITSNPKTIVYLNEEKVGSTPFFSEKIKPAEYKIKLVPESDANLTAGWEGEVELVSGVLTVISRDLGENEEKSSGYILSLEPKTDKSNASLSVITNPDGSVVSLNGEPKGFAPLNQDNLEEKEYNLVISSPGFIEKSLKAKLIKGYTLVAKVQLAKMTEENLAEEAIATESAEIKNNQEEPEKSAKPSPKASPSSSPKTSPKPSVKTTTNEEITRPYVEINSPAVGWVRVRKEPSTASEELIKVNHCEKYKYLDSENGWYKIEYEAV